MAYGIENIEIEVGLEAAVWRLDSAVRRDKICPVGVFASGDGKPTINYYKPDGLTEVVTFLDGDWRPYVKVGE